MLDMQSKKGGKKHVSIGHSILQGTWRGSGEDDINNILGKYHQRCLLLEIKERTCQEQEGTHSNDNNT
jgi:hypothetical protein